MLAHEFAVAMPDVPRDPTHPNCLPPDACGVGEGAGRHADGSR